MTLAPSLTGQTDIDIAPLGSLTLNSHNAPEDVRVDVTRLNATAARAIIKDPSRLDRLGEDVTHDVRDELIRLVLRSLLVATLGGLVVGLGRGAATGGDSDRVLAWSPRAPASARRPGTPDP